jgi:23S rRNA pseudouridine1911/1915/1917 synthase
MPASAPVPAWRAAGRARGGRSMTAEEDATHGNAATAEICADAAAAGQRLDRMLALRLPALSRMRLKRLIESGHVLCGGAPLRDSSRRVRPGQNFVVMLPEVEVATPVPQPIALDIRYEDAHLIVVDKPAGLVVHPAPGNPDGTLVNALLAHCGAGLRGIGGVRRPGIVHRLDKDTSGLIVVAKSEATHQALSRDFASRRIDRAYAALVWGVPQPAAGEIVGNIGRSPTNRQKMAVLAEGRGKPAVTRYRVERAFGRLAALVECRLATGRTHQIRVHLAHRGHPLIGDRTYGARAPKKAFEARAGAAAGPIAGFPRQALHARRLAFDHPASAERLEFESPLPPDLHALFIDLERF